MRWLFQTEGFPPRWSCGTGWADEPWLGWMHIASDLLTGFAYVAIPVLMVFALRKRGREFPAPGLVALFAGFILVCGFVHVLEAVIFYTPIYRISAIAKAVTALVSLATVGALAGKLPTLLAYRSPAELELEVAARTREATEVAQQLAIASQELREERERLTIALRGGSMGAWDWDLATNLVSFDETQSEITGMGVFGARIRAEDFFARVDPEDRAELQRACRESIDRLVPYNHSFRFTTPAGVTRWLSGRGQVLVENGEARRFVGVNFDVTRQKELEMELRRAQAQAESANLAKSRFLASTSHEIRTPLTAILGCAEALARDPSGPEAAEIAGVIRDQGQLLMRILNDVLDLSKIEAGKLEIHKAPCSPRAILADIESLMLPHASAKGLTLETSVSDALPETLLTDSIRVRQVLLNLISNAIKFTPRGAVRVRLGVESQPHTELQPRSESGQHSEARPSNAARTIFFEVADEGVGIAEEYLESIFLPFFQIDSPVQQRAQGTGLGLAISHRIASLLGGSLTVRSTRGVGSVFRMALPIEEVTDPRSEAERRDVDLDFSPEVTGRVLVAEDTRAVRFLLARVFASFRGKVDYVEDGAAAVAAVDEAERSGEPFDLVLLDMHMPELSGFEVARALRGRGVGTPIIALTASAMAGDREACLDAGCDAHLSKPIDWGQLVGEVSYRLKRGRGGADRG